MLSSTSRSPDNIAAVSLALSLEGLPGTLVIAFVKSPWIYKAWSEYPHENICQHVTVPSILERAISIFSQVKKTIILTWTQQLPNSKAPHWPNNLTNASFSRADHIADFLLKCHVFITRHPLGRALIGCNKMDEEAEIKLFLGTLEALSLTLKNEWDSIPLTSGLNRSNEDLVFAMQLRKWKEENFFNPDGLQPTLRDEPLCSQTMVNERHQSNCLADNNFIKDFFKTIAAIQIASRKIHSPVITHWQTFPKLQKSSSLQVASIAAGASELVYFPPHYTTDASLSTYISEKEQIPPKVRQACKEKDEACPECGRPSGLHAIWCPFHVRVPKDQAVPIIREPGRNPGFYHADMNNWD